MIVTIEEADNGFIVSVEYSTGNRYPERWVFENDGEATLSNISTLLEQLFNG